MYLFVCFAFWDKFSLDSPCWPGVYDPPASASHVMGLQTCNQPHLTFLVGSQTSFDLDISDSCGKHRVRYAPRTTFSWNFRCQNESSFYDVTLMIKLGLQAWPKNMTDVRLLFYHILQRVHAVSTICGCQCPRFLHCKVTFSPPSILYCLEEGFHPRPILKGWEVMLPTFPTFPGKRRNRVVTLTMSRGQGRVPMSPTTVLLFHTAHGVL